MGIQKHISGIMFYTFRILENLNECDDHGPRTWDGRKVWLSVAGATPSKPIGPGDMSWPS
jgi:hypothetical protein